MDDSTGVAAEATTGETAVINNAAAPRIVATRLEDEFCDLLNFMPAPTSSRAIDLAYAYHQIRILTNPDSWLGALRRAGARNWTLAA